jgi:hypothetical protein
LRARLFCNTNKRKTAVIHYYGLQSNFAGKRL